MSWRLYDGQPELRAEERTIVAEAFRHFDGERYQLPAYVVMPDHVHLLVRPIADKRLQDVVHAWKSFTARELQRRHGRVGRVWQTDYYNRIVRDEREYRDTVQYIVGNPREAWPEIETYRWVGVGRDDGMDYK